MGWREVFKLTKIAEKEEKGKEVTLESEQVSQFSHFPQFDEEQKKIDISHLELVPKVPTLEMKELFQERSAIREFEGEQSTIEAETGAIHELLPYIDNRGDLKIPLDTPPKYRWWQDGQSIEATLKELGASEETIKRYVQNKTGGISKPIRNES